MNDDYDDDYYSDGYCQKCDAYDKFYHGGICGYCADKEIEKSNEQRDWDYWHNE